MYRISENTALPGVIRVVGYLKEVGRLLILLALRYSAPHPSVKPAIQIYITNSNNNVNIPTKSREYVMKVKGIQFLNCDPQKFFLPFLQNE